mgnify:CR=1 FL=1|jgi:hypothetical protein
MEISNFRLTKIIGATPLTFQFKAIVTVTTRPFPFFKKVEVVREVHRKYGSHWHFTDTGKYLPASVGEELERVYTATHEKDLERCPLAGEIE